MARGVTYDLRQVVDRAGFTKELGVLYQQVAHSQALALPTIYRLGESLFDWAVNRGYWAQLFIQDGVGNAGVCRLGLCWYDGPKDMADALPDFTTGALVDQIVHFEENEGHLLKDRHLTTGPISGIKALPCGHPNSHALYVQDYTKFPQLVPNRRSLCRTCSGVRVFPAQQPQVRVFNRRNACGTVTTGGKRT